MLAVAGDEASYAPGDVLVVGADGQLLKSSEPYQQAVVGVYSTQSAVISDPRPINQRMGLDEAESAEAVGDEVSATEIEQFAAKSFELSWATIDGGGGVSSGGSLTLSGTIGQPDAGTVSGSSYILRGGFWGDVPASSKLTLYLPFVDKDS